MQYFRSCWCECFIKKRNHQIFKILTSNRFVCQNKPFNKNLFPVGTTVDNGVCFPGNTGKSGCWYQSDDPRAVF